MPNRFLIILSCVAAAAVMASASAQEPILEPINLVSETAANFWMVPTLTATPIASPSNSTNPSDWMTFKPGLWSAHNVAPSKGAATANYWHSANTATTGLKGGVGYDRATSDGDYTSLLDASSSTPLMDEMYNKETRVNIRIPFTIPPEYSPSVIQKAELSLRFDDAVGVYLANAAHPDGVKLLGLSEPTSDTTFPPARDNSLAVTYLVSNITSLFKANATVGANVLSLRGYNATKSSTDFLIQAKLTIVLGPEGRAPVADWLGATTPVNTPVTISLTGSDPKNLPLTFSVTQAPTHGSLSGTLPNLIYTPAANYAGPDELKYVVKTSSWTSSPATVLINVLSTSTDMVLAGRHPSSALTLYPRINSLKAYQGRLYAGHGNWTYYPACIIACFDPAAQEWRSEHSPGSDSVDIFREIDGVLYAPHCDPVHYEDLRDFSYYQPGLGWRDRTPVGLYDAFDFCKMNNKLYFCGCKDTHDGPPNSIPASALLMQSQDGGQTWTSANPTANGYVRFYWCFALNGLVYTQGGTFNGTTWTNGDQFAAYDLLYKPTVIPAASGDFMCAIESRLPGFATTDGSRLVIFNGSFLETLPEAVYDFTWDGTFLYALRPDGIYRGEPLASSNITWTQLPITGIPAGATSIEVMAGKVWVTDGSNGLWSKSLDGTLGVPAPAPKLKNAMPDGFGRSIVFDSNRLHVSAHEAEALRSSDNVVLPASGNVTVWDGVGAITNREWSEVGKLAPLLPMISGWYGKDMAANTGLLAIVEAGYDTTRRDRGSDARVHLFRDSVPWQYLNLPFAQSAAMTSSLMAVGAVTTGASGTTVKPIIYPYAIYRSANTVHSISVLPTLGPVMTAFGYEPVVRCAMNSKYVLGGFSGDVSRQGSPGMISLWSSSAVLAAYLTPGPPPIQEISTNLPDRYGFAVALSATDAAVGAPRDDTVANQAGAVYMYEITTATQPLLFKQKITSPVAQVEAAFGSSVAVLGNTLLIGAPGVDADGIPGRGAVYIYRLVSGTWVLAGEMLPPLKNEGGFGIEVTLNDTWMAGGSRYSGASRNFTERISLLPTLLGLANAYATWITATTLSSNDSPPENDPDKDGLINLVEYAAALDPLGAARNSLSPTANNLSGLPIVFDRPGVGPMIRFLARPKDLRLRQEIELSVDLVTWSTPVIEAQTVFSGQSVSLMEARLPVAPSGKPQFARLKLALQNP